MPSFTRDPAYFRIDNDAAFKGWTVSTLGVGGWFGALLNGYLCDFLSRRWAMAFNSVVCLAGT